jgi:hypothetical protein
VRRRLEWLRANHNMVQAVLWGVALPPIALTDLKESVFLVIVISVVTEIDTKITAHHAKKGRLQS